MRPAGSRQAALAAVVVLAYLNAFRGAFQFDDFKVIVDNPAVHSLSAWSAGLPGIRPLLGATYALNWQLGPDPFGYHLVNLALHVANALLLHAILLRFPMGDAGPAAQQIRERAAFSAALLWALHPLQTEAVTYLCGRSVSLMATLYLGSVLAYVDGRDRGAPGLQFLVSPLLFLLSFLAKETAVTLPAALALWEWSAPQGRPRPFRGPRIHWLMLGAAGLYLAFHAGYGRMLAHGFQARGWVDNLRSQVHAVAWLLSKLVWPAHLNLDPLLPVFRAWNWALAGEALLLASLLAAGLGNLRRRPLFGFGILWGFLHLVPTNSIVPRLDLVNERQMYLASAGFLFAFCAAVWTRIQRRPESLLRIRLGAGALAAAAVALGILTVRRNHEYRSEVALWESSVRADPGNPRAFNNLGTAYGLAGDATRAAEAYRQALRLRPGYATAAKNLDTLERWNPGPQEKTR